jgi:hypothetical protein
MSILCGCTILLVGYQDEWSEVTWKNIQFKDDTDSASNSND